MEASDTERAPKLRTRWVRRQYRVEGEHVKPVPGSLIEEYDPFDDGYYSSNAYLGRQPLYVSVWNLGTDIRDMCDFVSTWGPLGLLQHQLVVARYLANKPGRHPGLPNQDFSVLPMGQTADWFLRVTEQPNFFYGEGFRLDDSKDSPSHQLLSRRDGLGTVIVRHLGNGAMKGGTVQELPLEEFYKRYFPSGHFPSLNSPEFWDYYCEPTTELGWARLQFRDLYRRCVAAQAGSAEESMWFPPLQADLTAQLRGVMPTVYRNAPQEPCKMGWAFPSLLSAAYMMLSRDLTTPGRYLRVCQSPACGRPVVTDRSDRFYCSKRCATAERVRRHRGRHRSNQGGHEK